MNTNQQSEETPIDAAFVISAFERATRWLAAMPSTGPRTGMKVSRLMVLDENPEIWAHNARENRPPPPDAGDIEEMDWILGWLGRYIPDSRRVLRRIIALRSATKRDGSPASWYSIGKKLGLHPQACQRYHAQGLAIIAEGLNSE